MASEAVVSFVVGKLGDLLIEEARFLHGVRFQVESILRELRRMQHFLKDADAKQKRDERTKNWVAEIRQVSYEAEDVIDSFILSQVAYKRRRHGSQRRIKMYGCIFSQLMTRYKVGREIQRIKLKISEISSSRLTYGIRDINEGGQDQASSSSQALHEHRRIFALLEEPDVVGMQDDVKILKKQLINNKSSLCVVSIVGMGGSGKTTLAKKVYRDVSKNFECHAFIYLSQQYRIKDVLIRILQCTMSLLREEEMDKLNEQDLGKKLRDHLSGKRYLVVIDDIWTKEVWETLKLILPDGLNGSRVMLTTRNKEVASDPSNPPHEMHLLNDKESWELFLKRIFRGGNTCPSELEEIGQQVLSKCHGLPLAIVLLGSLLSTKDVTLNEWSKVLDSVNWHLAENSDQFREILALSYYDLPPYLKPCFLYLSLFPEDYEIESKRLIKLWIAEGFIQERGNEIMEDVAEDYLKELIDRCMIQVATKRPNGSVSTCRIHDLLHELSIYEAGENSFSTIQGDSITNASSVSVRRLALNYKTEIDEITIRPSSTLRSVLCFSASTIHWAILFRGSRLVRVLDVGQESSTKNLLENTRECFHLRYLRGAFFEHVSPSIGDLSNLQTLELQGWGTLPNAIWNLGCLRHLHAYQYDTDGHSRLNNLRNLRTLCLGAETWIENGLSDLANLRKLGIQGDLRPYQKALSNSIKKLCHLRSFKLIDGYSIPPFMSFTHHSHLYKMFLDGQIEELPEFPTNLAKLTLCGSKLEQDAIAALEKLPRLKILRLWEESYCSEKMICSSGGFPQLEILVLDCSHPEELIDEEGAMPSLKSLQLGSTSLSTKYSKRFDDLLSFTPSRI